MQQWSTVALTHSAASPFLKKRWQERVGKLGELVDLGNWCPIIKCDGCKSGNNLSLKDMPCLSLKHELASMRRMQKCQFFRKAED
eukprot:84802-Pelagomonas_calceolata.AAC.7